MSERRNHPLGVGRRLRRFVLIVIWAVPLAYLSAFISTATGGDARGLVEYEAGTAMVERCSPDGPLGMRFWYSCEVRVRWDDGDQSRALVPPPDLRPADIGTRVDVERMSAVQQRSVVQVERDRPWAWVWWVTGAPALALACLLVLIGFMVLFHGTRLNPARNRRQRPGRIRS